VNFTTQSVAGVVYKKSQYLRLALSIRRRPRPNRIWRKHNNFANSAARLAPTRRTPPKLVHKVLFSMPAGTPPEKLLAAVRNFARQEFTDRHRYALALHTDEPHPHVHVVVRAMMTTDLERLNIRKGILRRWRRKFAGLLRAEGVAAKATPSAAREKIRPGKLKGIYRPVRGRRVGFVR
jgi:hypothetical protein